MEMQGGGPKHLGREAVTHFMPMPGPSSKRTMSLCYNNRGS